MSNEDKRYIDIAHNYALQVVSGENPACRYTRLICQKHLEELAKEADENYPYYFDVEKAAHICRFGEMLPHIKGKWAKSIGKDRLIKLEPWQIFILSTLFGWRRKLDGLRRYRKAYIKVPRKNGKSVLAAVVGLYMFVVDREPGSEVYSGAGSEKQAWEVFGPAKKMLERTPAFAHRFGIQVNAHSLVCPRDGSKFEPVIGNPGDGSSPHCAIIDEYHEHKSDALVDTMETGMGAREHPLVFIITTAGSDIAGPCYLLEKELIRVLEGQAQDDQVFTLIYGIDEEAEWTTLIGARKANPNLGVSITEEFILSKVGEAQRSPRKQNIVKQKHFNVWTAGANGWMNMEKWNAAGDDTLNQLDWVECECWDGLDLASKVDIASRVRIYKKNLAGNDHYYVFGRHYVPESVLNDDEKNHYHEWIRNGYLQATDGNVIDHNQILADMLADREAGDLQECGYDQYNATMLAVEAGEAGINMVEVPQTTKFLSEPMKWITALLEDGRLHHDNNPCMNWMVSNVTAKEDAKENLFPRKESREKKIDGAVAMITAMAVLLAVKQESDFVDLSVLQGLMN